MFVVTLIALGGSADEEAPLLAPDLGVTAYEAGLLVRGALPSVVLRTPERARALDVLANMRRRGHEVVAFDEDAVVRGDALVQVRSFRLEDDALVAIVGAMEHRVGFAHVLAIVRAVHVSTTTSTETVKDRAISVGRALATGGLIATKTVESTRTATTESRDLVAYVFRDDGAPCLLAASRMRYDGLPEIRPSQLENFAALVEIVRRRTPAAAYDERLLGARPGADVDLLAHALALAATRRER